MQKAHKSRHFKFTRRLFVNLIKFHFIDFLFHLLYFFVLVMNHTHKILVLTIFFFSFTLTFFHFLPSSYSLQDFTIIIFFFSYTFIFPYSIACVVPCYFMLPVFGTLYISIKLNTCETGKKEERHLK